MRSQLTNQNLNNSLLLSDAKYINIDKKKSNA